MEDKNWLKQIKNGDCQAMDSCIDFYYPQLYRFVYRTLCGHEQSKDITQEVFIRFLYRIDVLDDHVAVQPYLYRIAVNLCNDYFRKRKRMAKEMEMSDNLIDVQATPDEVQSEMEKGKRMKEELNKLPFEQRTAIILRYYHQLKFKEIASILEISESTIKSRIQLGLEKLKRGLKEDASWMNT